MLDILPRRPWSALDLNQLPGTLRRCLIWREQSILAGQGKYRAPKLTLNALLNCLKRRWYGNGLTDPMSFRQAQPTSPSRDKDIHVVWNAAKTLMQ